ncbi:MAG: alpha/beta hydrolase, partial [Caldimonas sp.]
SSTRRLPDGRVTPHYDPKMVMQFSHHPHDTEQWDAWDTLDLPVLCLRGEDSDLLLRETAAAMRLRGPKAEVVEVAGCGHAPALNTPEHYALVERFFVAAG